MVVLVMAVFVAMTNLFLYCYFGEMASECYVGMAKTLYESNYFALPIHLQKRILFITLNMQQPIYYHGSKISVLNLPTFAAVYLKYEKNN